MHSTIFRKWHMHHEITVSNKVGVLESADTFKLRRRPYTPPVGIYWPMTYIESCACTSCHATYDSLNTKSVLVKFRISLLTDSHLYTPVKTITSFCVLNLRWHRLGWWILVTHELVFFPTQKGFTNAVRELSLRLFFVKKKQLEEQQIFLVVFFGASLTSLILLKYNNQSCHLWYHISYPWQLIWLNCVRNE